MGRANVAAGVDSFGALLQRHRYDAGLTQEELAGRSGLSVRTLGDLERGRTSRPYLRSVQLLADALTLADPARRQLIQAARAGNGSAGNGSAASGSAASAAAESGDRIAPLPVVPRQLPATVRHFAGRAAELTQLAGLLDQSAGDTDTALIVTLAGTAGVGKTTLAVHWAKQVADRFPDGQLYVNLRGFDPSGPPVMPADVIRGFLEGLQVPLARLPASPAAQADLYRSLLADRAMLVMLDNARDAAQVRPLLPSGRSCLVLVTSRSTLAGLAVTADACEISLDVLTDADARELLAGRLGAERIATEQQAVGDLIAMCARLPLPLAITASRAAAEPRLSLASMAAQLRDAIGRLDWMTTGEAATSVRAVFSLSYELLRAPAARMFRLLGVSPGPDISAPAAASLAGLPLREAAAALRELTRAHMLDERVPGRYACHDLLRAYAAEQALAIDGAEGRRAAVRRVLDHYLHTAHGAALLLYPARDPINLAPRRPGVRPESLGGYREALAWFTAEDRTLLTACGQAADEGLDVYAWQLPWTLMHFLDLSGRWHELAATQTAALAAAQRLGDHSGQAHAYCDLGRAYVRLACPDAALVQLRLALGLRERLGHLAATARIHLDVAQVAGARGRYREALDEGLRALDLYAAAGFKPGQARALNNIGWYHAQLGQCEQAVECCEQALALNRKLGNRPGEAAALDSLGYAYGRLGRHREAVARCGRAAELYHALGSSYEQAIVLTHLGDGHRGAGRPAAARRAWRQALAIFDQLQHLRAAEVRARLDAEQPGR